MANGLRPYPEYRDSGVQWLGEVPEHWEVRRLKTLLIKNDSGFWGTAHSATGPFVLRSNEQTLDGGWRLSSPAQRNLTNDEIAASRLLSGDLVITKSSGSQKHIGKTSLVTAEIEAIGACFSNFMQRVRLNAEVEPKLVWYLLNNAVGREQLVFRSSTTTGLANINGKSIAEFILPLPPADEQAAIVHFLDHADRRIRRYIRAKRKLIALLNEQKQVIIQQAVTRGLDPTVPMKDSGVEWLGEIPAHWKVRRVKSLSSVKRGASPRPIGDSRYFSTSGEYAWVRITDVTASDHYLERSSQKLSELGKSLSVALEPGALFLSIAGSVGKPIITRIKCCIHDGFVYFPAFKGNVDFLYYVFASGGLYGGLGKLGTQLNLNTQTVGNIYIGWPSEHEQAAIVSYLDSRLQNNAAASQSVLQQISRMNEYRTRLIADVVTGKLDVREAARHLPDEPDDLDEADDLPLDELNGEEDDLAELAEEPDAD